MADYVPGTLETDPKKIIMSLQQLARSKVAGPTSSTDNAAARYDGAEGTIQDSALLIGDTSGALSRSGGGGIPLQGTNTNDNASVGYVGEYISSTVLGGSAVSLPNNTTVDVTSISLSAGDWDVWGAFWVTVSAGTMTRVIGWINDTSVTEPTRPNGGGITLQQGISVPSGFDFSIFVGQLRVTVASTKTMYLSGQHTSGSTNGAFGFIGARRVR